MAVQDDLAAALSAIAAATTVLNTIGAQATGAIAQVAATYNNRLSLLRLEVFVNQASGSDANPGTRALPLKTLQAAINKVPIGGFCTVYLSADYVTDAVVPIVNRYVVIGSDGSAQRSLSFGRTLDASVSPNARVLLGFRFGGISGLTFQNLNVIEPPIDSYAAYQDLNSAHMFGPTSFAEMGPTQISFNASSLNIPTTPFGALLLDTWPVAFQASGVVLNGAVTSLNGRVMRGITSTTGTASTTIPQLVTTLSTI